MTTYRGYIIEPVFSYLGKFGGLHDFEVHREEEPEDCWVRHCVSLQQVRNEIDEKIEESTLTI